MFCVHCGVDGAARFCPSCGLNQQIVPMPDIETPAKAHVDAGVVIAHLVEDELATPKSFETRRPTLNRPPALKLPADDSDQAWTRDLDYQAVLATQFARDRLAAAAWGITPGLTADDLLGIFDAVSPVGVSLQKLNGALLPIYDKIGIKTLRWARGSFTAAPGRVLLSLLCALAKNSLEVTDVHQASMQCGLTVKIPSSLYTNQGELLVLLRQEADEVLVEIRTRIFGQYFDWGKSKRLIDELFVRISDDLTDQLAGVRPVQRRVA